MRSESTIEKVIEEYKKLTVWNVIVIASGSISFMVMTILLILFGYLALLALYLTSNVVYSFVAVALLVLAFVVHMKSVRNGNHYVKSNMGSGQLFENCQFPDKDLKKWSYGYKILMREFRYNKMENYIKDELHILGTGAPDVEKLNEIITYLEEEAVGQLQSKWKPVAILAVILFPLISEYVGFRYNIYLRTQGEILTTLITANTPKDGLVTIETLKQLSNDWSDVSSIGGLWLLIKLLLPLGLIWTLIIIIFKFTELILLSNIQTKRDIIKVLRMIKINR
ncbi:hypothetical protein [Paenibacillus periandrae]|uniref:hypothetical protein n=1 Tax=Paenibacillus periandrae TaxID=1761741 RepID=UPI001F08C4DD|nr:hypothetical protein [Paenibacillus periandrae]